MNGYRVTKGRTDMYNQDHRKRAVDLGYVTAGQLKGRPDGNLKATTKIKELVGAAAEEKDESKRKSFQRKFEGFFHGSMHWLRLSANGWHYGYVLSPQHRPKKERHRAPQPTFQVKDKDSQGYGAWYPYLHNYHHMIPEGAFHEYVIGDDEESAKRVKLVLASWWNINHDDNIVLLPQEVFISEIVGLPAHCPWGMRGHPEYSKSMKDLLKDAKESLDEAVDTEECEDVENVATNLNATSRTILAQIKTMQAGKQLSSVSPPGSNRGNS